MIPFVYIVSPKGMPPRMTVSSCADAAAAGSVTAIIKAAASIFLNVLIRFLLPVSLRSASSDTLRY